jgi:hypothetical protein
MGRPKQDEVNAPEAAEQAKPRFVLKKNFGLTHSARSSRFYPAGTEFDEVKDSELITELVRAGAIFE